MAALTPEELERIGFGRLGRNVRVSSRASIYNPGNILIGDDVRIDDFCVLSAGEGGIEIGSNVHIAPFCSLVGAHRIVMEDFSGLSARVSIFSSSDDYRGDWLTNPTVPAEYSNVIHGEVRLGRHVIVGAGAVILPGTTLGAGAAVGALSLVRGNYAEFGVYSGVPARRISDRRRGLLEKEAEFLARKGGPDGA